MEPKITLDQAKAIVSTKQAPRVTEDHIKSLISDVKYLCDGTLTIAIITMQNGFRVVGKAAPADPSNYDEAVGQRYAYDDAFKQIWQLEGYFLCTLLHESMGAFE